MIADLYHASSASSWASTVLRGTKFIAAPDTRRRAPGPAADGYAAGRRPTREVPDRDPALRPAGRADLEVAEMEPEMARLAREGDRDRHGIGVIGGFLDEADHM